MLYLTSKFHDNRVNTFGFMEGGGGGGAGTSKKPRQNRVKTSENYFLSWLKMIWELKIDEIGLKSVEKEWFLRKIQSDIQLIWKQGEPVN